MAPASTSLEHEQGVRHEAVRHPSRAAVEAVVSSGLCRELRRHHKRQPFQQPQRLFTLTLAPTVRRRQRTLPLKFRRRRSGAVLVSSRVRCGRETPVSTLTGTSSRHCEFDFITECADGPSTDEHWRRPPGSCCAGAHRARRGSSRLRAPRARRSLVRAKAAPAHQCSGGFLAPTSAGATVPRRRRAARPKPAPANERAYPQPARRDVAAAAEAAAAEAAAALPWKRKWTDLALWPATR